MKRFFICIVFILMITGCVTTENKTTPENLVTNYYESMIKDDMQSLSKNMHTDELIKFKNMMQPVFLSLMKRTDIQPPISFTKGDSLEKIELDTPKQFFERFMGFVIFKKPDIKDVLKNSTIHPIGHVKDGDMVHVVVKMTAKVKELEVSKLTVMSLKKDKNEWKLMLTGDIKGIAQMMTNKML